MKRSALRRGTSQLKRTPMKRGKGGRILPGQSEIEFRGAQKQFIEFRSGGRCECRGPRCRGEARLFHHRLLKSQGGRGEAANGLHTCLPCHTPTIHAEPKWSYRHGMMVRRGVDPATVKVFPGCPLDCEIDHVAVTSTN